MKTPEEIKKGLECCTEENSRCLECPYPIGLRCAAELMKDALAYIQQLEDAIDKTTQLIKSGTEVIRKNNEQLESTYGQVKKALCGKENATMYELLQAVDQLKKERTWHKTADNDFPEDHKPVLIAYKGIDIVTVGYWDDGFAEWDGLDDMEITSPDYWRELPEAPKEE